MPCYTDEMYSGAANGKVLTKELYAHIGIDNGLATGTNQRLLYSDE